ncbi:MAG: hypothetical protein ACRDR6_07330 [Pseudonocardiaceae bacterium]
MLAAEFVEWLMGFPAGWVTGVPGVTNRAALRLLGNAVLPTQATTALHTLLTTPHDSTTPTSHRRAA